MNFKSINLAFLLAVICWLAAGSVIAADLSLSSAKQQGLVGEQYDGYLGIVQDSASGEAKQLVSSVNAKRRAEYERIARTNGISVADVEALAGQKAVQKTAAGHYIRLQGQGWRQK